MHGKEWARMRAAVVTESGLVVKEVPDPRPASGEVLVRLRAIGLNRADLGVAAGHRHGNQGGAGAIPGIEGAGEVIAVGPDVPAHITPGMRVMASMSGSYAECCAVHWGRLFPVPSNNMPWEIAATLPIALQTMHDAVVTHGLCGPDRSILIQGASSGVGLMGLQVARLMGATTIIGTSTNAERRARLGAFGATHAVDTADPAWVDQVLDATGGRGVDAVVDMISGPLVSQTLRATRSRPSTSTPMRRAASAISASPSAPAARPRSPRSSARPAPICGRRWKPASCTCRWTAPIVWMR
jgi:NADPH2:quinone reductase